MAVFPSFNLTKKGEELLNRSIGEGRVLTFTKFKIGDGVPTGDWRDLENLQSSFKEFSVLETAIQADQVLRIRGYFDNKGFATDKQFKEIGVFVTLDGVAGEHLYSYTNAGDTGDIIPAELRGFYSRTLDVNNYIGYATNITFNIEQTRDNYDFNTENELKVATFLKKGDKVRLWGRLVLGDIETLNYIVTDEVTSFILDNGLYCKLAGDNRAFTVENDLINLKGAVVGDVVEVLGFHSKADGSHHKRIAKAEDDGSGELGQNGIWWCIVHSGVVEAGWFGAISSSNTDYRNIEIQKALNYFRDYQGDLIIEFGKTHWVSTSISCVWNKSDGYKKHLKGTIKGNFDRKDEIFFKVGLEISEYGQISNKRIEGYFTTSGDCKAVLKLYTQGDSGASFWNSTFDLHLECRRGYGLWVANGFFENTIERLRVVMMRKRQETDALKIGDESVCYVLSNESGQNIISSIKHSFINLWGGKNSILTTSYGNTHPPDFNADEVHVFDTTNDGLVLNNQGKTGCILNILHAEFIGRPDGNNHYACYWNGGGIINKIEGGCSTESGMVGFLRVYNNTPTPLICNSSGQPYSMPFKKNLVSVDVRDGAKFISNGYYFNPNNSSDISYNENAVGHIITTRYEAELKGKSIVKLIDKQESAFLQNEGVAGRLAGKIYDTKGIKNVFTSSSEYESYTPTGYIMSFSTTGSHDSVYNTFSFFGKEMIQRRKLEAYDTTSAIKVLGNFFLDMGLARELAGVFLNTLNITELDTPYYALKMQQEGIYEEYVAYRDELHEYENSQTSDETMLLPVLHESVIPESVKQFAEKYKLI